MSKTVRVFPSWHDGVLHCWYWNKLGVFILLYIFHEIYLHLILVFLITDLRGKSFIPSNFYRPLKYSLQIKFPSSHLKTVCYTSSNGHTVLWFSIQSYQRFQPGIIQICYLLWTSHVKQYTVHSMIKSLWPSYEYTYIPFPKSKVDKDMVYHGWSGKTHVVCIDPWPEPHWTPLGLIRTLNSPGLLTQDQCLTSLMLLLLNEHKSTL